MSDRPEGYEGLIPADKQVHELRQIGETLECILCLLEIETTQEPEPKVRRANKVRGWLGLGKGGRKE